MSTETVKKPPRPTKVTISKKKWDELFDLIQWIDSMPKVAKQFIGDRFFDNFHEEISELVNYYDKTDNYYTVFVERRGKKLFTLLCDQTTNKETWIPVVAK